MDRLDRALERLFELTDYERMSPRRAGKSFRTLDAMTALCRELGSPERAFEAVHLAGTKGKGSTAEMVAAILGAVPDTLVGLYTSPHLEHIRERIRVGGVPLERNAFAEALEPVLDSAPRVRESVGSLPTFFDSMTAAAFVAFRQAGVRYAVVECGLGGRLDSTNVVTPRVAAITSVSLDHVQVLGGDLAGIAREKAGIVKADVLFYASLPDCARTRAAVEEVCDRAGVSPRLLGRDFDIVAERERSFDLRFEDGSGLESVEVGSPGRHQRRNAALALAMVRGLSTVLPELPFDGASARRTLRALQIPARGEWFDGEPRVLLDGAHNVASARALRSVLDDSGIENRCFVVSIAEDKDWQGFLAELVRPGDSVIATRTENPRVLEPRVLAEEARRLGAGVRIEESAHDALASALAGIRDDPSGPRVGATRADDTPVVVAGSLYLAGLLRPTLVERGA